MNSTRDSRSASCSSHMESELSTTNRMSTWFLPIGHRKPLSDSTIVGLESGSHDAEATASKAVAPMTPQREVRWRRRERAAP